jgi:dTDP-4-dehydrorhamnose reductase
MRILLTGAQGQVGWELARMLAPAHELRAVDRAELDLSDADAIVRVVREFRPQAIVNAAAYTAVDKAETEPETAHAINARAPGILAEEARRLGAALLHYSTDYVFDGEKKTPYVETDTTNPINVYGKSKLAGEEAVMASGAAALVLRTSWVYARRGRNFLLTIERLASEREELRIVADQIGVPNWARTLAWASAQLLDSGVGRIAERRGLYHLSCSGQASWYDFAKAIVGEVDRPRILPIATSEYPLPARRPAYGVLCGDKLAAAFGLALPAWRDALEACQKEKSA